MYEFLTSMKGRLLAVFCVVLLSPMTYGQGQRSIRGTVLDTKMQPLASVTIQIKGTDVVTQTDEKGKYSISVGSPQAILIFSSVGYTTSEQPVPPQVQVLDLTMQNSALALEEVVAVGYGTMKRKDITGAVASINAEELKDIPAVSVLQAIAGRLPGVNVTIPEGSPDAEVKVRVRGGGSITQDNSPLYIVDGFQVANINDIPMTDIETIDVLKDAASTAIYGAQGANGVVLVTTKSGRKGHAEITLNSYAALSNVYNLTDVLSPYDYVYYQRELDPSVSSNNSFNNMYGLWQDIDIYKSKPGLNWQDQLFGNTGLQQNYSLGLNGGDETVSYNICSIRSIKETTSARE